MGENEIVGQFKKSFNEYLNSQRKDNRILQILEKLFKDAKEIRTQYLVGLSQKTYAGIARKYVTQKNEAPNVVIVGSGNLAVDMINQLKKKIPLSLCARNQSQVTELAKNHKIRVIPWCHLSLIHHEAYIINCVGDSVVLFDEAFFKSWSNQHKKRLFLDFGSPSVIRTGLSRDEGVLRLKNILDEGLIEDEFKNLQISKARSAITNITLKRIDHFQNKFFTK